MVGFSCGVELVAGFGGGFFSMFAGSIWWWVSVLAGSVWWWDLVLVRSVWWLAFVGSRVLVVARFCSRWWWSCLWVLFGCLVIFCLGFWWVRYWVWVWITRQWVVWFLGLWCMLIYGFVGLWCMLSKSKSTTHLEKISNPEWNQLYAFSKILSSFAGFGCVWRPKIWV